MYSFYHFVRTFGAYFGSGRSDEDAVDRWNRIYTIVLLVLFCVFVTTNSLVGEPVICWTSGALNGHDGYINTICWITNTYWLPFREPIPQHIPSREERELNYYQWVPIILLIQAFMFYVPRLVWRGLRDRSGINIKRICAASMGNELMKPDQRKETFKYLGLHIHDCIENNRDLKARDGKRSLISKYLALWLPCIGGGKQGTGLFAMYIVTKCMYLLNVIVQLIIIDIFLQGKHSGGFFGLELARNLGTKHAWRETGKFPRVTMCDFDIRVLGNLHRHTVQCVLPINLFNEKIYIFLWFWLFILTFTTAYSVVAWLLRIILLRNRKYFIKKYINRMIYMKITRTGQNFEKPHKKLVKKFITSFLRIDGVFALRMIQINTNELVISGIIEALWDTFEAKSSEAKDFRNEQMKTLPKDRFAGLVNSLPKQGPMLTSSGDGAFVTPRDEKKPLLPDDSSPLPLKPTAPPKPKSGWGKVQNALLGKNNS